MRTTDNLARIAGMHILVVDDDLAEIESLQRGLRVQGHSVSAAASGQEALQILEKSMAVPDMIITDYLMPDMDGIELLKAVRRKYGQLPVMLVTAYGSTSVLTEALQNGCDGFLAKSFTPAQLQAEIERIYGTGRVTR